MEGGGVGDLFKGGYGGETRLRVVMEGGDPFKGGFGGRRFFRQPRLPISVSIQF